MTFPTYPEELTDAAWQKAKGLKARVLTKTNVGAKLKALQEEFATIKGELFTLLPPAGGEKLFRQYAHMESHADKFVQWKKSVAKARMELDITANGLKTDDATGNKSMIGHLALVDAHLKSLVKRTQEAIASAFATAKQRQDEASNSIDLARTKAKDLLDKLDKENISEKFKKRTESLTEIMELIWHIEGMQANLPPSVTALTKYMKLTAVPQGDVEKNFKNPVKLGLKELREKVGPLRVDAYQFGA